MKVRLKLQGLGVIAAFIFLCSFTTQAEPLSGHLKRLTSALTSRNLDSLRLLIDPNRIFVEIAPKEGSYLSPSQTLAVIESFFNSHPPLSFSYILVKEEGNNGIAIGTLLVSENVRNISHKVNFGFQKNNKVRWLLERIIIQ
jgi:hypothetical protein